MDKVLVVFLKDTHFTVSEGVIGSGGTAQWHSTLDLGEIVEVVLGSGALAVFQLDDENGTANEHLRGRRTNRVAFFPPGGWSGYCWEPVNAEDLAKARAEAERATAELQAAAASGGRPAPRIVVPG